VRTSTGVHRAATSGTESAVRRMRSEVHHARSPVLPGVRFGIHRNSVWPQNAPVGMRSAFLGHFWATPIGRNSDKPKTPPRKPPARMPSNALGNVRIRGCRIAKSRGHPVVLTLIETASYKLFSSYFPGSLDISYYEVSEWTPGGAELGMTTLACFSKKYDLPYTTLWYWLGKSDLQPFCTMGRVAVYDETKLYNVLSHLLDSRSRRYKGALRGALL